MEGTGGSERSLGFDVRRAGTGLLVAAAGGFLLLVALLFMNWYSIGEPEIAPIEINGNLFAQGTPPFSVPPRNPAPAEPDFGAWQSAGVLGFLANLVLLGAAIAAIGLPVARVAGGGPAVDAGRALTILGVIAVVIVILRMIFPVDQISGYKFDAEYELGIFVALVGAILIAAGGFLARTEAAPPRAPAQA